MFNEETSNKYYNEYNISKKKLTISMGTEIITTDNLVIAIQHSKNLGSPYLKSEFYDNPIIEKRCKISVRCVPVAKSIASTIHSLQGKSYDENTHVCYHMTSKIVRNDLKSILLKINLDHLKVAVEYLSTLLLLVVVYLLQILRYTQKSQINQNYVN